MFPAARIPQILTAFTLLSSLPCWQSARAQEQVEQFREVYIWFNDSLSKQSEPGLQQISIDNGQLVVFTCWRDLAPGEHDYLAKIFNATGQEVMTHPLVFPGDKDEWETYSSYRFRPGSDQTGMWRYEIYLDGRLVEKQNLFVEASARAGPGFSRVPAAEWIAVKQELPEIPARAAGTGTRGSVGIEIAVFDPNAEPSVAIMHSEPYGLFDEAVQKAARKWRFQPSGQGSGSDQSGSLYYWIHFGDDVRIEATSRADVYREISLRKVGVTDARETMNLIAGMNIAPGELAYFSVAAEFTSEFEAAEACSALADVSAFQPVWSHEGLWYCAAHEILVVGADRIQSFIDTADQVFTKHHGRLYGTYVQD